MQNAVAGALASAAASGPVAAAASKMIGIQVGAVSFVEDVMSENSIALKTRGLWSRVRKTLCER
jgi:hypothetical protein